MLRSLTRLRPWLEPTVGAVFFALWCVAEAGRYSGDSSIVALAGIALAVGVSRVMPIAALAAVASVIVLQFFAVLQPPESTTWPVLLGVLFVVFVVAFEAPKRVAIAALILGLPLALATGYLVGLGLYSWVGAGSRANAVLMVSLVALGLHAGAWAIGYALRVSLRELRALRLLRDTTAQLGTAELELHLAQERDRIARDVHDVLAHSLAVVLAQADGARFLGAAQPGATDAALVAISGAARSALIDVRTLIEGLREEPGDRPQPNLDDLGPLIEQLRSAGLVVSAEHFGDQKVTTPAQQLAVFRIVQESLTNALRHAGRESATRVAFDWRGPGLALSVTTSGLGAEAETGGIDGTGDSGHGLTGSGHGLRGMRDRARLAGGWLTAGGGDGEFVVTAYIPAVQRGAQPEPSAGSGGDADAAGSLTAIAS